MTILICPSIRPEEYQAFRCVLKDDLPDTFEVWSGEQGAQKVRHMLLGQPNSTFFDVEITIREFTEFCRAKRLNYTLQTLNRLATDKGLRESISLTSPDDAPK